MEKRRLEHEALGIGTREGINSKRKGIVGEFSAAKVLTKWTGVKFTRTPSSGGLRWIDADLVCGDVVCTDSKFSFPFSVEVKSYKKFGLERNLRENSIIYTWWTQAKLDAARAKKKPMMMCRMNGMPKDEFYWVWDWRVQVRFDPIAIGRYVVLGKSDSSKSVDDLYVYKQSDILEFCKFSTFVKTLIL